MRLSLPRQPRHRFASVGFVSRWRKAALGVVAVAGLVTGGAGVPAAFAAPSPTPTTTASFSGGAGTVTLGGTLYAMNGGALTLNVTAPSDTQCVDVAGAFTGHKTSSAAQTSWTFTTTAGTGDGIQTATVSATKTFNSNGCTGSATTGSASYRLDNTGPVLTAATDSTPTNGWYTKNVGVTWTATDAGSGVKTGPTPANDSVTGNGAGSSTSTATDLLGNSTTTTIPVNIDRNAPTISGAITSGTLNSTTGWYTTPVTVTFTCSDQISLSGLASCVADGTAPASSSKTITAGGTVSGTALDNAGNRSTASVTVGKVDATAPTLSGAPKSAPNGDNGWYTGDVAVHWTADDAQSGIPAPPADTSITGEGTGLTSSTTVTNGAGLSTTGTSSPAVKIDRTAPVTSVTGASNRWTSSSVTVQLTATDNTSGVASTYYSVDGAPAQNGTSFTLSADGDHTISYFSTDKAGNTEAATTARVKIDKTAPTISHIFTPLAYTDGAWSNGDVTVTFRCGDSGSGVASCTDPVTKSAETSTAGTTVTGTATDNAGNSATNNATVRIDTTPPTITAAASGTKNDAGWYKDDVTVTFAASDSLSGIAGKSAAKVLGEGRGQSASGTATDAAGNSASAGVSGIDVDETAPVLTGSFPSGWNTDDVTVHWTCTDELSGVADADQPADSTVGGEGDALSASASCTDRAGNVTTRTVNGIKIDRTAPLTTGSLPALPDSGWYGSDVSITLHATDNASGVAATYYTVDGGTTQTYDGAFSFGTEGTHRIAFWSKDAAGNVETAGVPLTLKIDKAAPTTTVINPISTASGWYVSNGIPVAFHATDSGSGVAHTYYTIDGGDRQTYGDPFTAQLDTGTHTITYWSVDLAGNTEAHDTTNVLIVKVDTVAPRITGDTVNADGTHRAPNGNLASNDAGWFNGPVEVRFTCADADSGIAETGGCVGGTTLTEDGLGQSVHGTARDLAGNTGSADVGPVNIDQTKPALVGVPDAANTAGWHSGDVTVKWVGTDTLSGIDPASQPDDSTVKGEGSNLGAGPKTVKDQAGNTSEPASVSGINIDRTAPVITGRVTTQPNAAGWYKTSVTIGYTCTDPKLADDSDGSGIASCPGDTQLGSDGANQSTTSDPASDKAGNRSSGQLVGGINIDRTAPVVAVAGVSDNQKFTLGAGPTPTCTATDNLSGLASPCSITVTGGNTNGVGTYTYSATATDVAGNTSTVTGTYLVRYGWSGFLQPINDTAHFVGLATSVFKAGSTVPVKFQLTKADGTVVQAPTAPEWVAPVKGSTMTAPVDESVYTTSADGGSTFRYDTTSQQYIFNWKTQNAGGNYWRIGVKLDDGQTYYVNIGLK